NNKLWMAGPANNGSCANPDIDMKRAVTVILLMANCCLMKRRNWSAEFQLGACIAMAFGLLLSAYGAEILVSNERASGIYDLHEPMRWKVEVKGTNAAKVDYDLKFGGLTSVKKGQLELTNNIGMLEYAADKPGAVLAEFRFPSNTNRALGGAIAAPFQLQRADSRPSDFDDFWAAKIDEMKKIPANPSLQEIGGLTNGVRYWKISLDNIRGTHIRGQMARPASGDKLPALLLLQYGGVYPLQREWAMDYARKGWLVLNIEAHDLPIDEPASFYTALKNGALNNYQAIGNDNRETSYFLRMYLGCYRAAEYLASRPDWDGKTLVSMGVSQGGLQALVTAALDSRITAVLACVPSGCDQAGPTAGRAPGWPQWPWQAGGKDKAKVVEAGRYYDLVNMAPRIHCPVLIGTGLLDETCWASGVLVAYNQLRCPKQIVIMPRAPHQEEGNNQLEFKRQQWAWLRDLQNGKLSTIH
ncbi:MAG TPA: acetylxylan esterase, partial [Verrucomicrobiae bacterium]